MFYQDGTIILVLSILTYMMAIGVAIVAFWNYWKVRNWKLFVLAVSYALLAAVNIITPIALVYYAGYGRPDLLNIVSSITSGLLFTVFALLAYVYYTERRARDIKIVRLHWLVGCLVIAPIVVALLYFALDSDFTFEVSLGNGSIIFPVIPYLAILFIILLQTYTVISLYSYYKNVKNRNTLIVMAGFACLLLASIASFLFPIILLVAGGHVDAMATLQPQRYFFTEQIAGLSLTLAGYTLFLAALLRLKRS